MFGFFVDFQFVPNEIDRFLFPYTYFTNHKKNQCTRNQLKNIHEKYLMTSTIML